MYIHVSTYMCLHVHVHTCVHVHVCTCTCNNTTVQQDDTIWKVTQLMIMITIRKDLQWVGGWVGGGDNNIYLSL